MSIIMPSNPFKKSGYTHISGLKKQNMNLYTIDREKNGEFNEKPVQTT